MYNYFPHPSNLRQSSGAVALLIEESYAGYGIYLAILEVLRDAPDYRYSSSAKVWAYVLHAPDVNQVERVIRNFGLFDFDDDGLMFSPWLSEQMGAYSDKKQKLQEAGKRGAARRWQKKEDGQAIATPSVEDGQAIAILHNNTQYNITKHDETTPSECVEEDWRGICQSQGLKVDIELVEEMCKADAEGHNTGYIAQICHYYGIGQNVLDYLLRVTDRANVENERYKAFCALVKRIQREKYRPQYPANFFCSKI